MGLLKAGIGAAGGVLADSWREYFYCDALDANTLVGEGPEAHERQGPQLEHARRKQHHFRRFDYRGQ